MSMPSTIPPFETDMSSWRNIPPGLANWMGSVGGYLSLLASGINEVGKVADDLRKGQDTVRTELQGVNARLTNAGINGGGGNSNTKNSKSDFITWRAVGGWFVRYVVPPILVAVFLFVVLTFFPEVWSHVHYLDVTPVP